MNIEEIIDSLSSGLWSCRRVLKLEGLVLLVCTDSDDIRVDDLDEEDGEEEPTEELQDLQSRDLPPHSTYIEEGG